MFFDPEMVVPDDRLSLAEGAIAPWADSSGQYYLQTLESIAKHFKVKMSMPWQDLPKKVRDVDPARQRRRIDRHALRRRHPPVPDHQAVRRRDPQPRPALEGDRFVLGARGARALPAREQVRDLQRRPPQARGAGGQDRRPQHQPDDRVLDRRRGEVVPRARRPSSRPSSARSPPASSRRSTSGWASSTMSASTT